jgi:hypothetical protein
VSTSRRCLTLFVKDPRYRFAVFNNLEWTFEEKENAFECFEQQFKMYQDRYIQELAAKTQSQRARPTSTQSAPKRRKLDDDDADVALLSTGLFYIEEEEEAPDAEIAAYQAERPLAPHSDPLDYWRCNASRYPVLSRMV